MIIDRSDMLRDLPSLQEVCERPSLGSLIDLHGRSVVAHAVKSVLEMAKRRALASDNFLTRDELAALVSDDDVATAVAGRLRPGLRRVINATGVVLHGNLGRAPLAPEAVAAVASAGGGYATLEVDVATGGKARREKHVAQLVQDLLECEEATVVNNGAAGALLALQALSRGPDVLVGASELVEIGGAFELAKILESIGRGLVKVGTAQRTRLEDYVNAAGPETGAILKVQRSNYDVEGFSETVPMQQLADFARRIDVPLIHDLGSGLLSETLSSGLLAGEATPRGSIRSGASIVSFSGDKLMGGPQCGIVAGSSDLVQAMERHPLMRALRCDKLTLAALEATLRLYRDGRAEDVPIIQMLRASEEEMRARADSVTNHLTGRKVQARVVDSTDMIGGGAARYSKLPGMAVEIRHPRPERLAARLRSGDPCVLAVMREQRVYLHMRTVGLYEADALAAAVDRAARG